VADLVSFRKQPDSRNPRRLVTGAAIAGVAILAGRALHRSG
jgi:hypothetical protein